MNCLSLQPDLKAYVDGELPLTRRLAVRQHLAHCAACREEIKIMEQIADDLRATEPDAPLSPALRARILESTVGEEKPLPSGSPELGRGKIFRRPTLAWGIAGIVLVAWFLMAQMFGSEQRSGMYAPQYLPASRSASAPTAAGLPVMRSTQPVPAFKPVLPSPAPPTEPSLSLDRQVHKEATIAVQVANPEEKSDEIEQRAKEAGGFIGSNMLNTGEDGLKSADLTVKVPVAQFETVLNQIAKMGNVQSKNVSGEDITEKVSDAGQAESVLEDENGMAEARIKQLGNKARWADQQAIRDLRIQQAQARARLVLLRKMAALSTITVSLRQTPKPVVAAPATGGFLTGLAASTHNATQSLLGSAGALLSLLIWIAAYAPIWLPLALGIRYAVRVYERRTIALRESGSPRIGG